MLTFSPGKSLKHKTLSAYYPHILHLCDVLKDAGVELVRESDPGEYVELLHTTICGFASPPSFPVRCSGEVFGTQQEAIDRLLGELQRRGGRNGDERDVLLSGTVMREADLPINAHRPSIETRHVNSPSAVLRSLPWMILRSRIGDESFRYILLNASLFLPVGNNSFLQFSGRPIHALYQHPTASSSSVEPKRKAGDEGGKRCKKRRKKAPPTALDIDTSGPKEAGGQKKGAADTLIIRGRMFYGRPERRRDDSLIHGLPPHHILNKIRRASKPIPTDTQCLSLLADIFPSMFLSPSDRRLGFPVEVEMRGSTSRVGPMLGAMRELIIRHSKIPYAQMLWKTLQRCTREQGELNAVSHSQIKRYLAHVITPAFGPGVLGSKDNHCTILRHVRRFVDMKQYEPISLHTLLQDIRVNDFTWLAAGNERASPAEYAKRRKLVEELISWLFNSFIIPLLKNTFYITETASTRYETVYFTHEDWVRATEPHFKRLERSLLIELDSNEAFFAQRGPLGVSAVRLIPKPHGFRPIVNLGRRLKTKGNVGISILGGGTKPVSANQALRGLHQILTFEKERKRHLMGSSLFGTNEIFAPLRLLKQELLDKHGKLPRLYFVKMDIKAAFDTIRQDKMLKIVGDLLDKIHDYVLMLYALLLPPASQVSQGSARRLFKTKALTDDDDLHAHGEVAKSIAGPLRNAVIVDLMRRKHITRQSCLDLLKLHIQQNVWQVGDKFFRQRRGIPQGSKISSLLCSFFYACLEREHLGFICHPGSRLLRYIDDFLFISDDYHLARRFLSTMNDGFPAYGAFVSPDKTLCNFEYASGSNVAPVINASANGESWFPYCGFLIDIRTLDMSMDYPRMVFTPMQQSFALRSHRRRGAGFVGWFSRQLENRNHVGYLDTAHNELDSVFQNVFLNFALTAMKIPGYFASSRDALENHAQNILDGLVMSMEYTFVAGRARVLHSARHEPDKQHFVVKQLDFTYLALSAVGLVLSRKAGHFKSVHQLLTRHLAQRKFQGLEERFKPLINRCWTKVQSAQF